MAQGELTLVKRFRITRGKSSPGSTSQQTAVAGRLHAHPAGFFQRAMLMLGPEYRVIFDAQQNGFSNYPVDSQGEWRLLHDELSAVGYNPHKKVFFAACLPTQQGTRAPLLYIGGADPLRPGPTVRNRLHFGMSWPEMIHAPQPLPNYVISASSPFPCLAPLSLSELGWLYATVTVPTITRASSFKPD